MKCVYVALLAVLAAAASAHLRGEAHAPRWSNCNGNSTDVFDFFLLVNDWGPNTCDSFGSTCNSTFLRTDFALHGLWPNRYDGSWPQYCNSSAVYNPSAIQSLLPKMNLLWTDLQDDEDEAFWSHEWLKHGTCAHSVEELDTQYKFFDSTLNLIAANNYTEYMAQADIYASYDKTYSPSDIEDAIKAGVGADVYVSCDNDNNLATVTACVSKELEFMTCPSETVSCIQNTDCGDSLYIQVNP